MKLYEFTWLLIAVGIISKCVFSLRYFVYQYITCSSTENRFKHILKYTTCIGNTALVNFEQH